MKRLLLVLLGLIALAVTLGLVHSRGSLGSLGVQPQRSPEIALFTATPRQINRGEAVKVSWEVHGVESVDIAWGPERSPGSDMQKRTGLPSAGTLTVFPEESTVFVLECRTGAGDVCMAASASVRVRP